MITAYGVRAGAVFRQIVLAGTPLPSETTWLDMYNPTPEERLFIEKILGVELPSHEEMHDIELSNRLYLGGGAPVMTADLVIKTPTGHVETHAITCILKGKQLVTIRFKDLDVFSSFALRSLGLPRLLASGEFALLGLAEEMISQTGSLLRGLSSTFESVSQVIFWDTSVEEDRKIRKNVGLKNALSTIGGAGDLASKIQQSLLSLDRMFTFYVESMKPKDSSESNRMIATLQRDVNSLVEYAEFLSQKANFLLDATLGFINAEQNQIIKIFSVAAVIFLPPTLVASVYGMNFLLMPELSWKYGYPLALGLMLLAAVIPFAYFKRRNWI